MFDTIYRERKRVTNVKLRDHFFEFLDRRFNQTLKNVKPSHLNNLLNIKFRRQKKISVYRISNINDELKKDTLIAFNYNIRIKLFSHIEFISLIFFYLIFLYSESIFTRQISQ